MTVYVPHRSVVTLHACLSNIDCVEVIPPKKTLDMTKGSTNPFLVKPKKGTLWLVSHNFITSMSFCGETDAHDTKCRKWCNFHQFFCAKFHKNLLFYSAFACHVKHRLQHLSVKINIIIEHHFAAFYGTRIKGAENKYKYKFF